MMTRVLIATSQPILAKGFEAILSGENFQITDSCTDIAQAFEAIHRNRPEVALLDIALCASIDVIAELRKSAPHCQLVLWGTKIHPNQADEAVRLGARGVLPADVSPAQLIEALDIVVSFPAAQPTPGALVQSLCDSLERDLIALVGHGLKNDEIAILMHSDQNTVDKALRSASRRLGAQDRYELALYGLSTVNDNFKDKLQTEI